MRTKDYSRYVNVDDGVYWIGFQEEKTMLHSNPYVIVDDGEAIVIDGGSRPDFATVMLKILEMGLKPSDISALIYHHYDPDLCGSMQNFEQLIDRDDLVVISQRHNNVFINHYGTSAKRLCINALGGKWTFKSGRELKFINTPYSHSPGSFVTYDEKTKTLFSSDIFGSYSSEWGLFLEMKKECYVCSDFENCNSSQTCFMKGIKDFHRLIMTSNNALRYALLEIDKLDIERVAPQHGSIIEGKNDIKLIINQLMHMDDIGIDGDFLNKIF